jgi:hypothetical protein
MEGMTPEGRFMRIENLLGTLFDYLESGAPLEEFLIGFPPITCDQTTKVLELARTGSLDSLSRE